jgi:hypothetical protein
VETLMKLFQEGLQYLFACDIRLLDNILKRLIAGCSILGSLH